jgi:uncharacterized protein (DUF58 family)
MSEAQVDYRKYLDPRVLARVAGLDLRARLIVEGLMSGMHRSPMALGQQDAVGLVVADSEVRRFLRPANSPGQWRQVVSELSVSSRDRETRIGKVLEQTAEKLTHRSLLVVLSDFFDDLPQVQRGLRHIRHRRHEVIAFQLLDPNEIEFPFEDPTRFEGLEALGDLLTDPHALRASYLDQLRQATERLQRDCRSMRIDFSRMNTGDLLDVSLSSFLATRSATMR